MYQLWYGKQCSGYCGTGEMLRRWDKEANASCPNCGAHNETAGHLNRCGSPERRQLLAKHIEEIEEWMKTHSTHPELQRWIPLYLGHRGNRLFVDLNESRDISQTMRSAAIAHATVG